MATVELSFLVLQQQFTRRDSFNTFSKSMNFNDKLIC